ncbi:MAG: type II secretion system GspH family protein [Lachnospiraceae bacterium]|nr:type II secretion system GspH family protein [Lachnospiraceae bacterium]
MNGIKRHRKGFTLMEVMVSIALIGILFTPMLAFFSNSAQTNVRIKNVQRANTAAQAVMEEFRSYQRIEDIAAVYAPATADGGMFKEGNYNTTDRIYTINDSNNSIYYFQKNGIESDGKEYIARVKVDTTGYHTLNSTGMPVISSLGSDTTVVALEKDETLDKIREFRRLHFNETGINESIDFFAEKLNKTMKVEITDTDETGNPISAGMVHVRVYSEYTLNGSVPGCEHAQTGPDIYNGLMEESQLKGIYVFFNYDVTGSRTISQGFDVSIDYTNPPVDWQCNYMVYAVCQSVHIVDTDQILKDDKDNKAMTEYIGNHGSYMHFESRNSSIAGKVAKIWTNFPKDATTSDMICEQSTMDNIVGTEMIQRLSDLTVSIYNKDDLSKPVVTIDSTRGE